MQKTEKIYLGTAAVFVLVLSGWVYRALDVLKNYSSIESAQIAYHETSTALTYGTPAAFLILLILSNVIYFRSGQSRYFVYSYLVFAVFTVADYVFAGETYFHFIRNTGLWKGSFSVLGMAGLFLCFAAFILTVADYLVCQIIRKMQSPK